MCPFEFDILGIQRLERDCEDVTLQLKREVFAAVSAGVKIGEETAKSVHQWQNRSGATERSIRGRVIYTTTESTEGELVCTVPHASFLEEGTKPHTIMPRARVGGFIGPLKRRQRRLRALGPGSRNVLVFDWRGQRRFFASVWHPGTKPMRFMAPAYQRCEVVITQHLVECVPRLQKILDH